MNLLQIIVKNMRQRALSTSLTILSVVLGVALAIGILILRRESDSLFGQSNFGYELLLGPSKGSPLQLVLNTVYHLDQSPGVLPYAVLEDCVRKQGEPVPPGRSSYTQYVKLAIPVLVGDSVSGHRVVGTSPQMFGVDDNGQPVTGERFQYAMGRSYTFAQGRAFAPRKFEAVLGAETAKTLKLHPYDPNQSEADNIKNGGAFRVTHGMPGPNDKPDIHKPVWHVVGVLDATGTANDRCVFVPFISLYAIAEHEEGIAAQALSRAHLDLTKVPIDQREATLRGAGIDPATLAPSVRLQLGLGGAKRPATPANGDLMQDATPATPATARADDEDPDAYVLDKDGNIVPNLPKDQWELSAIYIKVRGGETGGYNVGMLQYNFKVIDERAAAVSPATEMRSFLDIFLAPTSKLLLAISAIVTVVAGASIATTIYNSVSARLREIAILRALGATRERILTIICVEAILIGVVGSLIGATIGHGLALIASGYLRETVGQDIHWLKVSGSEMIYLGCVIVLSFVAGLIPALKAYRTPVATNLVVT